MVEKIEIENNTSVLSDDFFSNNIFKNKKVIDVQKLWLGKRMLDNGQEENIITMGISDEDQSKGFVFEKTNKWVIFVE